jgi:hypothetical protein
MNFVTEYNYTLNKNELISTVKSYCTIPENIDLGKIFNELLETLQNTVEPMGVFNICKMPKNVNISSLKNCQNIIYCLITIGDKVEEKINSFFNEDKFYTAVLFDAMTSSLLFELSHQLFMKICSHAKLLNLGLTPRITPGDGDIDIKFQKNIVSALKNDDFQSIHIVNDYILSPSKSMSFIYGADKTIEYNNLDHNCLICSNYNCSFKKK